MPSEIPPCQTCKEVPLEENEEAFNIFFLVWSQLIMGMNGPVDVNHQAIHEAMKLYKIKKRKECFEKILTLSRWWINRISEKSNAR